MLISALVIKQIGRPILLITHMIACVAAGPHTCLNHLYSLYIEGLERLRRRLSYDYKQLLNEVFVISGIIKVEVSVISRSRRLRLITLTETLIIPDITKTESNNCFIVHCFEENNEFLNFLLGR